MVSTVYAGLCFERSGFEPSPGHCAVFFLTRHFTLTLPLFTQVLTGVLANLLLGDFHHNIGI